MAKDFISHTGEGVTLTIASKTSEHEHKHLDDVYNVILKDVIRVLNMHGGVNGVSKAYNLCPRWELKNNHRRDVFVDGIKPSNFVGNRENLGVVRITHDSSKNLEEDGLVHRQFELGFEKNQPGFITASEFYDLYKHEL